MLPYWILFFVLSLFHVHSSNVNEEIWIISPEEIQLELSSYISYLNSSRDLASTVRVFDHSDTDVPKIFPDTFSFTKVEKLLPHMVSKIILAGATALPSSWSIQELVHFVGIGGQILFALSDSKYGSVTYKEFLSQFGIIVTKFPVVAQNYTTVQWSKELMGAVFEREADRPLLYPNHTLGFKLDSNRSVNYLWNLISPEPNSVILNRLKTVPEYSGSMASLVTLFQSRNNGRLCAFPSVRFLFNEYFFKSNDYFNYETIEGCTRWTFMKRGILKIPAIWTYSENERFTPENPEEKSFRLLDTMLIFATLSKYSDMENAWKAYPASDLQFEYVIMKPFIRKTMSQYTHTETDIPESLQTKINSVSASESILFGKSIIPKRTGISTLRFWYLRQGYSLIDESRSIIIRHHAHNEEYTKFLLGYPYYASMLSCLVAIILVAFLFLLYKNTDGQCDKKNTQESDFNQAKKLKSS